MTAFGVTEASKGALLRECFLAWQEQPRKFENMDRDIAQRCNEPGRGGGAAKAARPPSVVLPRSTLGLQDSATLSPTLAEMLRPAADRIKRLIEDWPLSPNSLSRNEPHSVSRLPQTR